MVVIGRALAFFTHPMAWVGLAVALVHFVYQLLKLSTQVIMMLTERTAEANYLYFINVTHWSLYSTLSAMSWSFFILAFAVLVEYAARIHSDLRRISAKLPTKRGVGE